MKILFSTLPVLPYILPLIGIFFLSEWFQNPDAGEMYFSAINNGVMHPPGYVINGWLNRIFLFFWKDPKCLSLQSFIFSYLSFFYLVKFLKIKEVKNEVALTFSLLFFFNPYFLSYGLQPTKYTFVIFTQIYFLYSLEKRQSLTNSLLLGLCLSTHVLNFLLIIPFLAKKFKNFPYLLVSFLVFAFFQFTLFFQNGQLWPNWMPENNLNGILHLLSREDIKHFNQGLLSNLFKGLPLNAFIQNFQSTFIGTSFFWFFPLFIFFSIRLKKAYPVLLVCLGLFSFLLLNNHPYELNWLTQNERWAILTIPYFYILAGIFYRSINNQFFLNLPFNFLHLNLILSIGLFYLNFERLNLNGFNYLKSFHEALGSTDIKKALFLDNSDETIMLGIPGEFPLLAIKSPWYMNKFLPAELKKEPGHFLKTAFQTNGIKSTNGNLFKGLKLPFFQKGLWFYSGQNMTAPNESSILKSNQDLCRHLLLHKQRIPNKGHHYQIFMKRYFTQAFALNSQQIKNLDGSKEISTSLKNNSFLDIRKRCVKLLL